LNFFKRSHFKRVERKMKLNNVLYQFNRLRQLKSFLLKIHPILIQCFCAHNLQCNLQDIAEIYAFSNYLFPIEYDEGRNCP